jgi:hypothetical protein
MVKPQHHQQKKYFHQIILYLFLLILIVIFIATVGIKLIINITLYVAEITHQNRDKSIQQTTETEFLLPPEISDLPNATNSAIILITTKATSGKNLSIYINDQLKKEILLQEDSVESEIELSPGENSIYLLLKDPKTRETKKSVIYKVIYKNKKPFLEITSPKDQEKFSKEDIQVMGKTEKEVFVRLNELPIVTDTEGKFSYNLKLKEGENKIIIVAQDIAGNIETKELTVIYQKEE